MPASRTALTVIDPSGQGGPANNGRYPFELVPKAKNKGRTYSLQTRPWQPADPKDRWRIPLHPFAAGLRLDKIRQHVSPYSGMLINRVPETYSGGPIDASPHGVVLPPPLVSNITLTNGTNPDKAVDFNGLKYFRGGRYLYYYDPVSGNVVQDKDFGAGNTVSDMAVAFNTLVVGMGTAVKIWQKTNTGAPTSGTANAAVSTTATTLADTRLALTTNAYIGSTVFCGGQRLTVTSNTATTFTGTWDAQPASNLAWNATGGGAWTQATDSTFAVALGISQNSAGNQVLWASPDGVALWNCTTGPLTLANWGPSPKYAVGDGDTLYPIHTILSYGGTVWAINGKGAWQGDPQGRFKNQCPQMESWPDTSNGKGTWLGAGYMFVPTVSGVYRLKPGESKLRGPELTGRPSYRWRVRNGLYFGACFYLIADDLAGVGNTCIIRMVADDQNISPENHDYLYFHLADVGSTTPGYFITVTTGGTNPTLIFGNGNNISTITLDRGGVLDGIPSDPNYNWGTSATLTTGVMMPSTDLATVSNLVGTELVCKVVNAGESLTLAYNIDDQGYQNFLNTVEGGGVAPIVHTTDYQSVIRYANPDICEGQQMQFKLTGSLTTTTTRWEVREWWVFGYSHSKVTDVIDLAVMAEESPRPGGMNNGLGHDAAVALWKSYVGSEIKVEIEGYETGHTTRFVVAAAKEDEVDAWIGPENTSQIVSAVSVTLIRVDRAGSYAS